MNELASRRSNGRFAKGNPGGPGNPFARQVANLRKLILEAVTEEDLREIVRALVERAKGGDIAAIREVLNRVAGKAPESPDPDRLELDEMKLRADIAEAEEDEAWQKSD
jgi:hypothetical protein